MWAFKQAVEATLERRGYDGQLWEALEGGFHPEEETQAAAEEGQAAVGMTRRRQQPGGVVRGEEGRGQTLDGWQRRAALPSQLMPAILRWADLCKEVTLLKMEDVHVSELARAVVVPCVLDDCVCLGGAAASPAYMEEQPV